MKRELRRLLVCYKKFLSVLKMTTYKIYFRHQFHFSFNSYKSVANANSKQPLQLDWDNSIDCDRGNPEYKFYDNIGVLPVRSFWYHSNDTKRNPWVMCVHIAQLMTHPAMYTIPFTLQLCYKPLGILQRVTKSQKVHISSHDGLKKLHNIKFAWHRLQNLPEKEHSSRNFSCPNQIFWTKNTPLWLTKRIFSNDQKEQIVNNFKKLDNVHSNATTIHQYL